MFLCAQSPVTLPSNPAAFAMLKYTPAYKVRNAILLEPPFHRIASPAVLFFFGCLMLVSLCAVPYALHPAYPKRLYSLLLSV